MRDRSRLGRTCVGPFPYADGSLTAMSMALVRDVFLRGTFARAFAARLPASVCTPLHEDDVALGFLIHAESTLQGLPLMHVCAAPSNSKPRPELKPRSELKRRSELEATLLHIRSRPVLDSWWSRLLSRSGLITDSGWTCAHPTRGPTRMSSACTRCTMASTPRSQPPRLNARRVRPIASSASSAPSAGGGTPRRLSGARYLSIPLHAATRPSSERPRQISRIMRLLFTRWPHAVASGGNASILRCTC